MGVRRTAWKAHRICKQPHRESVHCTMLDAAPWLHAKRLLCPAMHAAFEPTCIHAYIHAHLHSVHTMTLWTVPVFSTTMSNGPCFCSASIPTTLPPKPNPAAAVAQAPWTSEADTSVADVLAAVVLAKFEAGGSACLLLLLPPLLLLLYALAAMPSSAAAAFASARRRACRH